MLPFGEVSSPIHQLNRYLLIKERELQRAGDTPPGVLTLVSAGQFATAVLVEFLDDHCLQMAAALSYTSLLALVPVTTLFFSVFTAFRAFERLHNNLRDFITNQLFFENPVVSEKILAYLDQFTSNSKQVGIFSVVALIVTVISLMITIENSLNLIWQVPTRRKLLNRVITYSALMFLAPISLALSLYTTDLTFGSVLHDLSARVGVWKMISGFSVSCLMFFVLYMAVPEVRVKMRPALLGSATAALLFEWAKWSFGHYLQVSAFYFHVYSTLAVVPIFLVWLYLVWLIVLFGMEITYIFQNRHNLRAYARSVVGDGDVTEAPLVATMCEIAKNFADERTDRNTPDHLSRTLAIPVYRLNSICHHLEEAGFIHRIGGGGNLAPNRPLDQISIQDILESLHTDQVFVRLSHEDPRFVGLRDLFLRCSEFRRENVEMVTLEDVVRYENGKTGGGEP